MKLLHFVDTAGSDETFVFAANINQIRVASTSSVVVSFPHSGDEADNTVTLTTATGKSDEVALRLAQEIGANQIQYGGVLKVIATTAPFADVTTVAFAAGS